MAFSVKMKSQYLPGADELVKKLGVDSKGDVQQFVTDEIVRRLPDYIPKRSGALRASVHSVSATTVVVEAEYVRAQFFGVTKHGVPFNYNTISPKVGSHWDRRLYADEGAAIVAATNDYIRRKSKK